MNKWKAWWYLIRAYHILLPMWTPIRHEGVFLQEYGKHKGENYHRFKAYRAHFEVYNNGDVEDYDQYSPNP